MLFHVQTLSEAFLFHQFSALKVEVLRTLTRYSEGRLLSYRFDSFPRSAPALFILGCLH